MLHPLSMPSVHLDRNNHARSEKAEDSEGPTHYASRPVPCTTTTTNNHLLCRSNSAGCKRVSQNPEQTLFSESLRPSTDWVEPTVDLHLAVAHNLLDLTVRLQVSQGSPGERAVDLQSVDEGGDCDEAVGLHILL